MNANFSFPGQAGDAAVHPLPARHFSDTRTAEGRVRFLLVSGSGQSAKACAELLAEGPGWTHRSRHASLQAAATYLAALPQVSQSLYEAALSDLERRRQLEQAA